MNNFEDSAVFQHHKDVLYNILLAYLISFLNGSSDCWMVLVYCALSQLLVNCVRNRSSLN
jgi:hypothetical protein